MSVIRRGDTPRRGAWLAAAQQHPLFVSLWCACAGIGAYSAMYLFRKPFTAALFVDAPFTPGMKSWLVTAQVAGYMTAKFVGIRVVSAMPLPRRTGAMLALLSCAELSLVLFGVGPTPVRLFALFLNGLALGMLYSMVVGFLEGRRMTEAFVSGLVASFIVADGVAKSVGIWVLAHAVSDRWMPAVAGLFGIPPVLLCLWMLHRVPAPAPADIAARAERVPRSRADRRHTFRAHAIGLICLMVAFLLVTVLRSLRADFAPELWAALGASGNAALYTRSELWVAGGVLLVNGLLVTIQDNRRAFFVSLGSAMLGIVLVAAALLAQQAHRLEPFPFLVLMGLGLYLPYAAVHTTLFERLLATTRDRANLGWLMSIADAFGYLGYVAVMLLKSFVPSLPILAVFTVTAWTVVVGAGAALATTGVFFLRRWRAHGAPAPERLSSWAHEQA